MNSEKQQQQAEQALLKRYREISNETPGSELDAKIIAAAHASAAQARPVVAVAKWRRWSTPLASAAVLVLGITFVIKSNLVGRWDHQSQPQLDAPVRESTVPPQTHQAPAREDKYAQQYEDNRKAKREDAVPSRQNALRKPSADSAPAESAPKITAVENIEVSSATESQTVTDNSSAKQREQASTPADTVKKSSDMALQALEREAKPASSESAAVGTIEKDKAINNLATAGSIEAAKTSSAPQATSIISSNDKVRGAKLGDKSKKISSSGEAKQASSLEQQTSGPQIALEKAQKTDQHKQTKSDLSGDVNTRREQTEAITHGAAIEEVMVTAQKAGPRLKRAESRISALDGIAGMSSRSQPREKKMLTVTDTEQLQKLLRARYNEWYFIEEDEQWLTLRRQFNQRRYKIARHLLAPQLPRWYRGQVILSSDIPLAATIDSQNK